MKELMIAMMVWLSGATGYEIPELPAIKFLQPLELKSYAWGCEKVPVPQTSVDACNSKDTWDEETSSPLGLYDFETKTIILREGFDINTVHDKSILLHELAHHLQYQNNKNENAACLGELEREAYDLQDKWLKEKYDVDVYSTIGIDEFYLIIITQCREWMY